MTIVTEAQLLVEEMSEAEEKKQEQDEDNEAKDTVDVESADNDKEKDTETSSCQEEKTENTNKSDEGTPDTPSDTADCPPPMPITISFGTTPGCSGWQIIKKRDPTMTFDEQLIIEYFKMVNEYSDYWDRKSTDGSSSTPISAISDDGSSVSTAASYESFIDNAPPGLPKGKESANGRSRPKKGKWTQPSKA